MSASLSISFDDLHVEEISVIRRLMRNVEIRRLYQELRPVYGQLQSITELSIKYRLSETQIRNILYGRR